MWGVAKRPTSTTISTYHSACIRFAANDSKVRTKLSKTQRVHALSPPVLSAATRVDVSSTSAASVLRQSTRSWRPTRGRRWDGDLDVLLGSDGTMAVLAPCAALAAQRGRRGRHAEDEKRAHLSSSAAARQRTGSQLPMRRAMWRPLDVGRGFGRSLGRS